MMKARIRCFTDKSCDGPLCPFLHQTRTIRRPFSSSAHLRRSQISAQTATDNTHLVHPDRPQPTESHNATGSSFLRAKAAETQAKKRAVPSSITPQERQIFENIKRKFGANIENIDVLQRPSLWQAAPEQGIDKSTETLPVLPKATPASCYDTDINHILNLFAPEIQHLDDGATFTSFTSFATHLDPDSQPTSPVEPSHKPYPAYRVRAAALTALQHLKNSIISVLQTTNLKNAHPPDVQLWHHLTNEVFVLPTFLQPRSQQNQHQSVTINMSSTYATLHRLTLGDIAPSTRPSCLTSLSLPDETPLLPLLTILYPSATLLSLRLFATHYPASPFILNILPTIRHQGPISYLLAGNVHLLNTLLQHIWDVYSDFVGMEKLLKDFKRDAVNFDEGTLGVISFVREERERDLSAEMEGRKSVRSRRWWTMPGQVEGFKRLNEIWSEEVREHIQRALERERKRKEEIREEVAE